MTKVVREALQKRFVNFYLRNKEKGESFALGHFSIEKVPSTTVYIIIAKYEKTESIRDLPRSGHSP